MLKRLKAESCMMIKQIKKALNVCGFFTILLTFLNQSLPYDLLLMIGFW